MSEPFRPDVETFLDSFFAPPNRLTRDRDPRLRPWLDRLRGPTPAPVVLPCVLEGNRVVWYGMAFDDRQFRSLGEDLTAFIGPSYTTFRGEPATLDSADPIESAVANLTQGRAYSFTGDDSLQEPAREVWRVLERMRQVWERSRRRPASGPPILARLLRDFYAALEAGNGEGGEVVLAELRDWNLLDPINRLYLRVRLDAAMGRWKAILQHPQLPDLLKIRRPQAVTEALAEAVYQTHLRHPEDQGDLDGMMRLFQETIQPQFGPLYTERGSSLSPGLLYGFMLSALSRTPPDGAAIDDLLSLHGLTAPQREALQRLATLGEVKPPQPSRPGEPTDDVLSVAARLVAQGDYGRSLELLSPLPSSLIRARLLCQCAYELRTLESKGMVIQAVESLPPGEREEFLRGRMSQQVCPELSLGGPKAPSIPKDWLNWIDLLADPEQHRSARQIAAQGATEWPVQIFVDDASRIDGLVKRLLNLPPRADAVLNDCLPHMIAFFRRDPGWPNRACREVYQALADLIHVSTRGSEDDLTLFGDVLEALLRLGFDRDEYSQRLEQCRDLWQRFSSLAMFDWLLNLLATISEYPCPVPEQRRLLLDDAVNSYLTFGSRGGPEQRTLLIELAALQHASERIEALLPAAVVQSSSEKGDAVTELRGMSLAIYSLTESAARLAGRILESEYDGVKIQYNHELDCSRRLQQLARNADLFVMVTASSKHAATGCIETYRPSELPLLRPTGKGAASILRAVRQYFTNAA